MTDCAHNVNTRFNANVPCPVCGSGTKGCSRTEGGLVFCRGVFLPNLGDTVNGHALVKKGEEFYTYKPDVPRPPRPRARVKVKGGEHMDSLARRLAANFTGAARAELAHELGVSEEAVAAVPLIGFSGSGFHKNRYDQPCWTFPETDAAGNVVGICCRYPDGEKKAMPGGKRGLAFARGWQDLPGPVSLCEGPSDLLALHSMGLAAVARPSNTGGVALLAELVRDLPAGREVVVLGENDCNQKGQWPGLDGAKKTAAALTAALGRPVTWVLPPGRAKDVRAWVKGRGGDWAEKRRLWLEGTEGQANGAGPGDAPASADESGEIDAEDLLAEPAPPDLEYLPLLGVAGYFVEGWSHLLAGYPRSGKTELLIACARDWANRGVKVLFITEEPRRLWRHRLEKRQGPWRGVRLVFGLGRPPAELLARITGGKEPVVIIDTIRNLGVLGEDENDNAAVAKSVTPWVAACRGQNKTLIMGHHMRKSAGEHGEGIAGGHALFGSVDVAIELRRDNQPNRRVLRCYARVIAPEDLMYEMQEDGSFRALGSPSGVTLDEVRQRVRSVVGEDWLETADVMELLEDPKPGKDVVTRALAAEARGGFLERDPSILKKSVAGKRVKWRRTT
jgi:phage/plasmid primase-like uncharacterized protein